MLLAARILALALVCAEIDASASNSSQAKGHSKWESNILPKDAKAPSGEVKRSQRQLGYLPVPVQTGLNYVAVGADGHAEVAFRLDMSLFMQKLNMIPQLFQVAQVLEQKVDKVVQLGIGPGNGPGLQSFAVLEQLIVTRLNQQDVKINGLYQLVEHLREQLGGVSQQMGFVFATVQQLLRSGAGGMQPQPGFCGQQLAEISALVRNLVQMIPRILQNPPPFGGGEGPTVAQNPDVGAVISIVQQNSQMLGQSVSMMERIWQRMDQGGFCPPVSPPFSPPAFSPTMGPIGVAPPPNQQVLQGLTTIMSLIEKLPQQLVYVWRTAIGEGATGAGGASAAMLPYLQQVMQLCEGLRLEVVNMRESWFLGIEEIRRHMAESQKSMVAVKKTVTETTEMMQSSAAAAISASRSLRCPSESLKP